MIAKRLLNVNYGFLGTITGSLTQGLSSPSSGTEESTTAQWLNQDCTGSILCLSGNLQNVDGGVFGAGGNHIANCI